VAEATKDALFALMECVLDARATLPASVANHFRATIASAIPNFVAPTGVVVLTETIRSHLGPALVPELVDHDEQQALLKQDGESDLWLGTHEQV
jgi:hypothetical protein